MSNPLEYLARAQDCLFKAVNAPNQEVKQKWLDAAGNWLDMVPQDLRTLAEMLGEAERDQGTNQASKTRH